MLCSPESEPLRRIRYRWLPVSRILRRCTHRSKKREFPYLRLLFPVPVSVKKVYYRAQSYRNTTPPLSRLGDSLSHASTMYSHLLQKGEDMTAYTEHLRCRLCWAALRWSQTRCLYQAAGHRSHQIGLLPAKKVRSIEMKEGE